MGTNRPWNWRLTGPKTTQMTNLKTLSEPCTVSACSPLLLPVKSLAPLDAGRMGRGEGGPQVSLWADVHHPSPPVASNWIKASFPFHQPGLFTGFEAASSQTHTHSFSNNMAIFNISPKSFCKIDIQWSYTIFFWPYNPFICTAVCTIWKSTLCGTLLKICSYSSEYKVL